MITILLFILQSLSSVLCLNCSDVRQSNGFGIYVWRYSNGGRYYYIYDKNGKHWKFNLTEKNGEMEIERFDESFEYTREKVKRFSNYFNHGRLVGNEYSLAYNCKIKIDTNRIICHTQITAILKQKYVVSGVDLKVKNPVVFKTFPKINSGYNGRQMMVYNRHNKSDRIRLQMLKLEYSTSDNEYYGIETKNDHLEDIQFIEDMDDTLFSQLDSTLDYNLDHKRGLSGHMLWFNIKDKHYYCFQPEGKTLSEEVFIF